MAGFALTASGINDRAGSVANTLWKALEDAHAMSLWLSDATHDDTTLGPTGVGVPTTDLTIIRASFADLGSANGLWGVAHNLKTVSATNDFFFNAKKLAGPYWAG
jgi:hypothetical protein